MSYEATVNKWKNIENNIYISEDLYILINRMLEHRLWLTPDEPLPSTVEYLSILSSLSANGLLPNPTMRRSVMGLARDNKYFWMTYPQFEYITNKEKEIHSREQQALLTLWSEVFNSKE